MTTSIRTQTLGFPRIGDRRELKRATESYWQGRLSTDALHSTAAEIRQRNWRRQKEAGIDLIPCNDFSFYDQMLDMTCLLGNVPQRYAWDGGEIDLDLMFTMARGARAEKNEAKATGCHHTNHHAASFACEMTKWFDTNYHYIVPEFNEETSFRLSSNKIFDELAEAHSQGISAKPVLIGPLTYLTLGKEIDAREGFSRFDLLDRLLPVYSETLQRLLDRGAEWVQLDEPILALDLSDHHREMLRTAYASFAGDFPDLKIMLATYFGALGDNFETVLNLPLAGIHMDAVRGGSEVERIIEHRSPQQVISLGVIDGRNIWKTDLSAVMAKLRPFLSKLDSEYLVLAPSCSLLHVPVSLEGESQIDPQLRDWLAFADEKLEELGILKRALEAGKSTPELLANETALHRRRQSREVHHPKVQARVAAIRDDQFRRPTAFAERQPLQRAALRLPAFPTTTIGSFPQTKEVRKARAKHRKGEWTDSQYDTFLRLKTSECVDLQESLGIDVIVHGEFERNDMVEYFGEKLEGFAFTANGWVQSYGTRCVKPPIIFGDVSRPKPMTVEWSKFAQSKTERPVKGMLTGPVTILQWSFVRDDQPRRDTAMQIALAIRDEVNDLEQAGLQVIQIDEPALREGLPLTKSDWPDYLDWAVKAFRLSSSGVQDATQIHTHMCYCEFNDIIEAIAELDADVITIETARSNLELLDAFTEFRYPNEIGPGVYDIHSPRVPTVEEIKERLGKTLKFLPADQLWVNPDCGLKTRGGSEVHAALKNMVAAAVSMRGS